MAPKRNDQTEIANPSLISMNGQHKKASPVAEILYSLRKLTVAQALTLIGVLGSLFAMFSFVYSSKATTRELPEIKAVIYQKISDHEKKDEEREKRYEDRDRQMVNAVNELRLLFVTGNAEIKTRLDVTNQKVDDMKEHGFGEYSGTTKEAIKKIKRNNNY